MDVSICRMVLIVVKRAGDSGEHIKNTITFNNRVYSAPRSMESTS